MMCRDEGCGHKVYIYKKIFLHIMINGAIPQCRTHPHPQSAHLLQKGLQHDQWTGGHFTHPFKDSVDKKTRRLPHVPTRLHKQYHSLRLSFMNDTEEKPRGRDAEGHGSRSPAHQTHLFKAIVVCSYVLFTKSKPPVSFVIVCVHVCACVCGGVNGL